MSSPVSVAAESAQPKLSAAERIAALRALKESAAKHGEESKKAGAESRAAGAESRAAGAESRAAGAESRAAGAESRAAGADAIRLLEMAEQARIEENNRLKTLEEESKKGYAAKVGGTAGAFARV